MRLSSPPASPAFRKRRGRTAVATTVAAAVAFSGFGATAATAVVIDPDVTNVDIVSINDFHGRLEPNFAAAGAAVLAGMVDAYEADNPSTIFASAGDSVGATTFTSFIQQDVPTINILNDIGLDVSAFGNHEFDKGRDDVARIEGLLAAPLIAANIYLEGTETPAYQEYEIIDADGVDVAFIGAITEDMPSLVSGAGIAGLDFGPIVPAVNRVADQLSDDDDSNGEADVIVLLVHEGAASPVIDDSQDDSAFGVIATDTNDNVDAIVSGHTHTEYNHLIPTSESGKLRPVVQSGEYGEAFAHLDINVNTATGELVDITAIRQPLGATERTAASLTPFVPNADVQASVDAAVTAAEGPGGRALGTITDDLLRAQQSTGSENRGGESTIGNFVADSQLFATRSQDTEIALMNPGGLRADLGFDAVDDRAGDADGVVTYREAADVQSFGNTLFAVDLTGESLKAVLEEQWQPDGAGRPFLKLGVSESLTYTYDPTAARGERITAIYLNGELVTPEQTIRTAVNSFLASGTGDNFTAFGLSTNRVDTGQIDLQGAVEYFESFNGEPVAPPAEQRAVGVVAPAEAPAAGADTSVTFSSLLFSADAAADQTVELYLGETLLGTSVIDATIVDTTDEVGRATVEFTVPAGVGGDQVLTAVVEGNGTSVDFPFAFAALAVDPPVDPPVDPAPVDPTPTPGDGTGTGGTGSGSGGGTAGSGSDADDLAYTGASNTSGLWALMALLLGSGGLLLVARRRALRNGVAAE